jgi:hypothetical protein
MTNTTEGPATDRQDPFGSLTPMARQEAVELCAAAEERRRYLATLGSTPVAAFRVLITADFVLRNGLPDQKISVMLQLLKDYDIDLGALQDAKGAGHTRIQSPIYCQ